MLIKQCLLFGDINTVIRVHSAKHMNGDILLLQQHFRPGSVDARAVQIGMAYNNQCFHLSSLL
ncbi:hypothetical protein D3C80_2055360 [compost metagenome]